MSVLKLNPSVSDPPKSSQGFSAKSYSLHETVTEFCMEILAHQYQQRMCEIKALNKISEVGYLSGTIVKAVWLGYPILKKKKITGYKSHFPEAL